MGKLAIAGGSKYDLYTFITHPGASGVGLGGQLCNSKPQWRVSFNSAYGPNQCNYFDPPTTIDCSKPTNRIALTAEVDKYSIYDIKLHHNIQFATLSSY